MDSELKCFPRLRLRKQVKSPGVIGKNLHRATESPSSSRTHTGDSEEKYKVGGWKDGRFSMTGKKTGLPLAPIL